MAKQLKPWFTDCIVPPARKEVTAVLAKGKQDTTPEPFWLRFNRPKLVQVIEILCLSEYGFDGPAYYISDGDTYMWAIVPYSIFQDLDKRGLMPSKDSLKGALLALNNFRVRLLYDTKHDKEESYVTIHIDDFKLRGNVKGEIFGKPKPQHEQKDFAELISLLREVKELDRSESSSRVRSQPGSPSFATQAPPDSTSYNSTVDDNDEDQGASPKKPTASLEPKADSGMEVNISPRLSAEQLSRLKAGESFVLTKEQIQNLGLQNLAKEGNTKRCHQALSKQPAANTATTTTREKLETTGSIDSRGDRQKRRRHAHPTERTADDIWAGLKISKRNVTIPKAQLEYLKPGKPENWLPGPANRPGPLLNIPIKDLNEFTARVDYPSSQDSASDSQDEALEIPKETAQQSKKQPMTETADEAPEHTVAASRANSPANSQPEIFPSTEDWPPSSPIPDPKRKILPPDSEDEESVPPKPLRKDNTVNIKKTTKRTTPQGAVPPAFDGLSDDDEDYDEEEEDEEPYSEKPKGSKVLDAEKVLLAQDNISASVGGVGTEDLVNIINKGDPTDTDTADVDLACESTAKTDAPGTALDNAHILGKPNGLASSPPVMLRVGNRRQETPSVRDWSVFRQPTREASAEDATFVKLGEVVESMDDPQSSMDKEDETEEYQRNSLEELHAEISKPEAPKEVAALSVHDDEFRSTPREPASQSTVQVKQTPAAYFHQQRAKATTALSNPIIPATMAISEPLPSADRSGVYDYRAQPAERVSNEDIIARLKHYQASKRNADQAGLGSNDVHKQSRLKLAPSYTDLSSQVTSDPHVTRTNRQAKRAFLAQESERREIEQRKRESTETRTILEADLAKDDTCVGDAHRQDMEVMEPGSSKADVASGADKQVKNSSRASAEISMATGLDLEARDASAELVERFMSQYPVYRDKGGNRKHLVKMAKEAVKNLPKLARFWDDYIIRNMVDYRQHVNDCMMEANEYEKDYTTFWDNLETGPLYTLRVLNKDNIDSIVSPLAMHTRLNRTIPAMSHTPSDHRSLRTHSAKSSPSHGRLSATENLVQENTKTATTGQGQSSTPNAAYRTAVPTISRPVTPRHLGSAAGAHRSSATKTPRRLPFGDIGVRSLDLIHIAKVSKHSPRNLQQVVTSTTKQSSSARGTPSTVHRLMASSTSSARASPSAGWSKSRAFIADATLRLSKYSK